MKFEKTIKKLLEKGYSFVFLSGSIKYVDGSTYDNSTEECYSSEGLRIENGSSSRGTNYREVETYNFSIEELEKKLKGVIISNTLQNKTFYIGKVYNIEKVFVGYEDDEDDAESFFEVWQWVEEFTTDELIERALLRRSRKIRLSQEMQGLKKLRKSGKKPLKKIKKIEEKIQELRRTLGIRNSIELIYR